MRGGASFRAGVDFDESIIPLDMWPLADRVAWLLGTPGGSGKPLEDRLGFSRSDRVLPLLELMDDDWLIIPDQ